MTNQRVHVITETNFQDSGHRALFAKKSISETPSFSGGMQPELRRVRIVASRRYDPTIRKLALLAIVETRSTRSLSSDLSLDKIATYMASAFKIHSMKKGFNLFD